MKISFFFLTLIILSCFSCNNSYEQGEVITRKGVSYDFTLTGLSVSYIESGDSSVLPYIARTRGMELLYNHANWSGNNSGGLSVNDFAKKIIDRENQLMSLELIRRNLMYAKDSIAATDYPQKICLQYLPAGFSFSSRLCFTIGYDLGIVYLNNASINLSHKRYLENCSELKYYSIHELHHAGFVTIKKGYMPSLQIKTFGEMAELIAYFTHLEGMAVYAAYNERKKGGALNYDQDYVSLQDSALMKNYTIRYFEIYNHFLNNGNDSLTDNDWLMLGELSSDDRLWYRVGAQMAALIDKKAGREKLTALITGPSGDFINTYLSIRD